MILPPPSLRGQSFAAAPLRSPPVDSRDCIAPGDGQARHPPLAIGLSRIGMGDRGAARPSFDPSESGGGDVDRRSLRSHRSRFLGSLCTVFSRDRSIPQEKSPGGYCRASHFRTSSRAKPASGRVRRSTSPGPQCRAAWCARLWTLIPRQVEIPSAAILPASHTSRHLWCMAGGPACVTD